MADEGYLQLKVRENNEKINKIESELFESKLKISSFERMIDEMKNKLDTNNNKIENVLKSYDANDIKSNIKEISKKEIDMILNKRLSVFLSKAKDISLKTTNEYKDIAYVEATSLYDRILKDSLIYNEMIFKAIGDILLSIHKTLLENKLISKPFDVLFLVKNFNKEDIMYIINFEDNKVQIKHGKKLIEYWNTKYRLRDNKKFIISSFSIPIKKEKKKKKVVEVVENES